MGMVRQWQQFFHGGRYAESYTDSLPDFISLANSFGIKGMRVMDPNKLKSLALSCEQSKNWDKGLKYLKRSFNAFSSGII